MGPGGAPMMGDGPPHPPGNYYNNFFNQQDGMKMEGMTQDGENYFQIISRQSLLVFFLGLCADACAHCFLSGDYQGFAGMDEKGGGPEGSANGASSNQGGISVPDFLPPAQRVLFLRIQQKQQEEEERARRMAEGGSEKSRDNEGQKRILHLLLLIVEYILDGLFLVFINTVRHFWSSAIKYSPIGISQIHSNIIY